VVPQRSQPHAAAAAAAAAGEEPCVLDLGAGSGALALLAAKAGAPHVVAVEAHKGLVRVARAGAAANGVSSQVRRQ
jgi:predicted RNA methylase